MDITFHLLSFLRFSAERTIFLSLADVDDVSTTIVFEHRQEI